MSSPHDGLIITPLDRDLSSQTEAVHIGIGWVSEEDACMDFGFLGQFFLASARGGKLERAEKTCW